MVAVYAIVGGNAYQLDCDGSLTEYLGAQGVGALPVQRFLQTGYQQQGATDYGYKLQPRVFRLLLRSRETLFSGLEGLRDSLSRIFDEGGVSIRWTRADTSVRQIDCFRVGELDPDYTPGDGFAPIIPITLQAPDPTFYDPTQVTVTWTLTITSGLLLPLSLPIFIGTNIINSAQTVAYTGSADTYPVIELTGPLTTPKVYNETLGLEIAFTAGTTIAVGETVTIDCTQDSKTVTTNLGGGSRIGDLSDGNDLALFRLARAVDGTTSRNNVLRVTASGAVAGSSAVRVKYYTRDKNL